MSSSKTTIKPRKRRFLKKCPDGCEKNYYSLGLYRGFKLTQKPFYAGWAILAELALGPDDLDKLMLGNNTFPNEFFDDTERLGNPTLSQIEEAIIKEIDDHWTKKQKLLDNCQAGRYKVKI